MISKEVFLGKPTFGLRECWLQRVRDYAPHQSKPAIDRFQPPRYITSHPLRLAGRLIPALRKSSGLALSAPSAGSCAKFKVWEKSGEEYVPVEPRPLLGQPIPVIFRDYLPSFKSRASFILSISGGLFHGHDQTLLDRHYNLIDWEAPYWAVDCGLPGTMFRGRLPKPKKLKGRALVLSAPGAKINIWHFLFDCLPKLQLVEQAGFSLTEFDHIIVNECKQQFQVDALSALGVRLDKVIEAEAEPLLQADEMVFVTLGCLIPPDPWVLHWLRKRLAGESLKPGSRLIYLSRGDAPRRRLRDESSLWSHLRQRGFKMVEFEGMSLKEQMSCVQSARVIVAPHGAGLTNLVWAAPGTKVVELFASEFVNPCFWLISDMLGLDYSFAVGEPTIGPITHYRAILDAKRGNADIQFPDMGRLAHSIIDVCQS